MSRSPQLPASWTAALLRDLAIINPPSLERTPADDAMVSFVPMAAVEPMTGRMDASSTRRWASVKKGFTRFQEGDVVLAKITPSMENGKAALARDLINGVAAGTTEFHVFRPVDGVVGRYLLHYFLQESFRRRARGRMTGTAGQLRVPTQFLNEECLPLAPTKEQLRIVEALDCYLTRLDEAVARLERAQAKLKAYRASVLKAAVEGRLVPTEASLARAEKRDYEPADVLLARILKERRRRWEQAELARLRAVEESPKDDKWKAKYEEPTAPKSSGVPQLPKGWCWATLDQLCADITDGDHQPPPVSDSGVPFLVIGDVRTGNLDFSDCRTVPRAYYDGLPTKRKPNANDLLYTVVGSFGIPVRIPGDRPFCVQRHIAILKSPSVAIKDYLFTALSSDFVFHQAAKMATGTAQKTVALGPLRRIAIPVPPLREAARIADEAARLLSNAEEVLDAIRVNRSRTNRLRQAILNAAFEGKLVDQDPNDEPAETLLARIRAERSGAALQKKVNGRRRRGAA